MASPSSGTPILLDDAPRTEIPLHEVPTSLQVRQQFYNEDHLFYCRMKKEEFYDVNTSWNEPSNTTIDTSLFPYQMEGPFDPPLPTISEICAAKPRLASIDECEAWRVGSYMVKAAPRVTILQEAENLLYLERRSTVRTPKVYAVFANNEANPFRWPNFESGKISIFYIIMEYIEGITVGSLIDEAGDSSSLLYVQLGEKLGEQLRRLRAVEPEVSTHFGRIGGRPYPALTTLDHPPASSGSPHGPFNSYEECVTRFIHSAKVETALRFAEDDYCPLTKHVYREAPSILLDYPKPVDRLPVLSHMDLQDHNIMVKVKRDDTGEVIKVEEVIIIDWQMMCWMPSWFEPGDLCRMLATPCAAPFATWACTTLETMGYLNMAIVFFYAMSIHRGFVLEHM